MGPDKKTPGSEAQHQQQGLIDWRAEKVQDEQAGYAYRSAQVWRDILVRVINQTGDELAVSVPTRQQARGVVTQSEGVAQSQRPTLDAPEVVSETEANKRKGPRVPDGHRSNGLGGRRAQKDEAADRKYHLRSDARQASRRPSSL
jgi:hypothetical protein